MQAHTNCNPLVCAPTVTVSRTRIGMYTMVQGRQAIIFDDPVPFKAIRIS